MDGLRVTSIADLKREKNRLCLSINGRSVTLFLGKDRVICMDSLCYHQGGDLSEGEIKAIPDIENLPAITCPRHGHQLLLDSGRRVLYDEDGHAYPSEVVQRTHKVHVDMKSGDVFVKVEQDGSIASDRYASTVSMPQPGPQLGSAHQGGCTLGPAARVRQAMAKKALNKKVAVTSVQQTIPSMLAALPAHAMKSPQDTPAHPSMKPEKHQQTIPEMFRKVGHHSLESHTHDEMDIDEVGAQ